jgi:NADH:ubiquinone oxidoreductase subunit 5 (subunit L)/multisubunit Na+/H+ antiporter MnhA subunit
MGISKMYHFDSHVQKLLILLLGLVSLSLHWVVFAIFVSIMQDRPSNDRLARKETWTVHSLKLAVLVVLVASAVAAAVLVHDYATDSETARFRDQFESDANKVLEAIGSSLEKTLSAMDSLSVTLVTYAQYSNSTWPYVTMPNFAVAVAKILPLSNAIFINVLPIVQPHQRVQWEHYSRANDAWVNESMKIQETWKGYYGPIVYDWEPNPILHGLDNLPYNLTYVYSISTSCTS